jgi:metal-dependent amidase/aminoacylase/carboxypeptidase family protein
MRYILVLLIAACASTRPSIPQRIAAAARASAPRLVELRRDLHRHPELAEHEVRTSAIVAQQLARLGLEVRRDIGGHGVVGVLRGKRPGGVVAYRADMDAFPGDEPAKPDASTVPGVHHVCGHDVHVAVGIGIATVLSALRDELPGTVVFVFQPAEETLQGAAAMLRDGALADPRPDAIFAVHTWPLHAGMIGYAPAEGIAGKDEWVIDVGGDGEAAARIVDSFTTVSLPKSPDDFRAMLRALRAGGPDLENAVFVTSGRRREPDGHTVIEATVKAAHDAQYPALRRELQRRLDRELGSGAYTVRFPAPPFPGTYSSVVEAERAARTLEAVLGAPNVVRHRATLAIAGEDFGLYLQQVPGAFFYLGVANPERGITGTPHMPDFDVDESAIEVGTRAMANVIWRRLAQR